MNDVPLREHIETLLDSKFSELDRRLGQLNDLHAQVGEDRMQFVTNDRLELLLSRAEGQHEIFATKLDALERWRSRIYGGAIVAGFVFLLLNAGLALLVKYF